MTGWAPGRPALALVVPCYNEEDVLPETIKLLTGLLDDLSAENLVAEDSHVCFIDDGSRDATWRIITDARSRSRRVGGLRLSRNRGHQHALLAGLLSVRGDVVVSMDADLQDDPKAIRAMLLAWQEGADIVYGVRSERSADTAAKRLTARLYYRLLHRLGVDIVFDHADYRLMSRRAVDALREYGESNLFLRALIPQLGFESRIVTYERGQRFAGSSKYPLRKMVSFALEGVTSFSTRPLRMVTLLGCVMSALALALTLWAMSAWLIFSATLPGWASIVIPVYLVSGVQLLSLGVIGEYVGKIYLETKRRPRYHVAEHLDPAPAERSSLDAERSATAAADILH